MRVVLIALGFLLAGCPRASTPPASEPEIDNAAVPASNTSPPGGDVTLRWRPDPVGSQHDLAEHGHSEMLFGGKPLVFDSTELRHVEVLESDDFVTKLEAYWEEHHEIQTMDGQSMDTAEVVEGHAYVVWKGGEEVAATRADGAQVSKEELDELADAFDDDLGTRPAIVDVLLRRAWKTGEEVELGGQDLVDLTNDLSAEATADAARMTLASVDGGSATFTLELEASTSAAFRGSVAGVMTFVVDTDPLRPIAVDGELELRGNVDDTEVTGKATQSRKYTYR